MADELATLFAQFEDRAAHLNASSDSVNTIITAVESRLRDANMGLEVWLRRALTGDAVKGPAGAETTLVHRLGYAKIDGEWCLAVKPVRVERGFFEGDTSAFYVNEDWAGDPTRLAQASRAVRIAALDALPELVKQMTEEAEACIQTIDQAKRLAIQLQ